MTDPLRRVVAVVRGYGSDSILFECGHRCSAEPVKGRRPYPVRRRCHNCNGGSGQQPMVLAEWIESLRGGRERYTVIDASAQWAGDDPAELAARERRAEAKIAERERQAAAAEARRAAEREHGSAMVDLIAEARRWHADEAATEGFCYDECEHHECKLGRAVARYVAADAALKVGGDGD